MNAFEPVCTHLGIIKSDMRIFQAMHKFLTNKLGGFSFPSNEGIGWLQLLARQREIHLCEAGVQGLGV